MRALVLAAGLGTRLRPLTLTTPKPLVDVAGRPLIHYAFDLILRAGIREIAVNLHHLGSQIREALGDGSGLGARIRYFEEEPILDTGGAIAACRDFFAEEPFVVVNSDTITDLDLGAMIAHHSETRATATMFLRSDPEASRYGVIEIDATKRIRRFLGQPAPNLRDSDDAQRLTTLMFGGIHVFDPRVFAYMQPGVFSITRETYPRMLAANEPLYAYVHEGFWHVLDTPEGLESGRAAVTEQMSK